MKKKIINGIMMVALVAATSTSFVSCKDTNDDVRIENASYAASLLSKLGGLDDRLTALEGKYGDLEGKVSGLRTDVNKLREDVNKNTEDIGKNTKAIEAMEKNVTNLEVQLLETFTKLVTGINVSATYSNMTGAMNFPGSTPKMLIFNRGEAQLDGSFPLTAEIFGVQPIEWNAGDKFGQGEKLSGFAGIMYANVDQYLKLPLLSKWQDKDSFYDFSLVTTKGEKADILIGNVDEDGLPTTDELEWGWTRDDVSNVYKLGAVYVGEDAESFKAAPIDLKNLKADIKAVWKKRNAKSLAKLAQDFYYNYATKETNLPMYALKLQWEDFTTKYDEEKKEFVETDGVEHSVTSDYDILLTSVKPLAFTNGQTLVDATGKITGKIDWTAEKVEKKLNQIIKKIKAKLPNPADYEIKDFNWELLEDSELGDLTYDENANTWFIVMADWDPTAERGYREGTDVDVSDIVEPMFENLETAEDLLIDVQKTLNKFNANSFDEWVKKYTTRTNKVAKKYSATMLQPTLLAMNNGVVNRVSGTKPTVLSGEVILKPTTYSAEFLAPCYAKFVGCKDIDEENFNQILYCGEQELKFTPEAGKIYEIVYEAVDFFGNTFEHTYYIQGGLAQ
jgi:hypothetical protein